MVGGWGRDVSLSPGEMDSLLDPCVVQFCTVTVSGEVVRLVSDEVSCCRWLREGPKYGSEYDP